MERGDLVGCEMRGFGAKFRGNGWMNPGFCVLKALIIGMVFEGSKIGEFPDGYIRTRKGLPAKCHFDVILGGFNGPRSGFDVAIKVNCV